MTEQTFDDQVTGYFLPEDSQLLLTQVRNHIHFLARLAQPRIADEAKEWAPVVGMAELMFCMDQLAEQLDVVLKEVTWPAHQGASDTKPEAVDTAQQAPAEARLEDPAPHDDAPYAEELEEEEEEEEEEPEGLQVGRALPETGRYVFGVTTEQIDELNLLVDRIMAYGDAVSADDMADFAPGTLATLGHTIFDRANELDELVTAINAQTLAPRPGTGFSVEEPRPAYGVQSSKESDRMACAAPATAYLSSGVSPSLGGLRLH